MDACLSLCGPWWTVQNVRCPGLTLGSEAASHLLLFFFLAKKLLGCIEWRVVETLFMNT